MPLSLEPDLTLDIVLDTDKDKPKNVRPVFYSKSLNMRKQSILASEIDAAWEGKTADEVYAATCELLKKYIIGFSNMGQYAFGTDYQEFLSHEEAREILRKVLINQHVTPDEKKS